MAVAGAKGGVGTTVIASHLAWDAARSNPQMRVCLVDLDIESGDVPSYLDVSHRVSIADLAKISEDLTSRAVADTVVVHSSGLHLLLAPNEIRDTEFVTPEAVRRILGAAALALPPGGDRRGFGDHHHPGCGGRVLGPHPPAGDRRRAGPAGRPPADGGLGVARAWPDRRHPRRGQPLRPAQRDPAGHGRRARARAAVRDPGARSRASVWNGPATAEPRPRCATRLVEEPARDRRRARRGCGLRAAVAAVPEAIEGADRDRLHGGCGQKPSTQAGRRDRAHGRHADRISTTAEAAPAGESPGPRPVRPRWRRRPLFPVALVLLVICLQFIMLGVSARLVAAWRPSGRSGRLDRRQPAGRGGRGAARRDAFEGVGEHGGDTVSVTVGAPADDRPGRQSDVDRRVGHTVVEEPR